jgi:polyisoprenoid-binding protein YceI
MTTWNIDTAHSEIGFKVKHLVISTVKGTFTNFDAQIHTEGEDFENSKINFTAHTDSITTNNTHRDEHLKNADFFDVAQFPTVSFDSTGITKNTDGTFAVNGNFTMHGVTKPLTLTTTYNGSIVDAYGNTVKSFDIHGSLHRSEFGLVWNAPLESGGVAVSDEVKLDIVAEFKEVK